MSPQTNQQYPTTFYHIDGKNRKVNSPAEDPKGEGWRKQPWPTKPPSTELDVNAMPPDMAIAHLKDQLAEAQGEVRSLKTEKDYQARQFDLKYGTRGDELAEAKAKVAELDHLLAEAHARIAEIEAPPKKAK